MQKKLQNLSEFFLFQFQTAEAPAATRQVVVNGQQTSALLQAMKANMEAGQQQQQQQQPAANAQNVDQNKQFVVTPDYIQQSMCMIYHPSVIVYNPNCAYPLQNDYIGWGGRPPSKSFLTIIRLYSFWICDICFSTDFLIFCKIVF